LVVGLAFGVRLASGVGGAAVLLLLETVIALAFASLGSWAALRTGSTEAVQGLFPVFFVFLFLSSMNIPRNLIEADWFRWVATVNPVSYLIEAVRALGIYARHRGRVRVRRRIGMGGSACSVWLARSALVHCWSVG